MPDKDNSFPRQSAVDRLCLLITITLIILYSLAPFDLSYSATELKDRAWEALSGQFDGDLLKMGGHFLGFFILGGLAIVIHGRALKGNLFVPFAVVATLFCLGLEFTQLFLPTRHARVTDLICNFVGVMLGGMCVIKSKRLRSLWFQLKPIMQRYSTRAHAAIFFLATAIWFTAGFQPVLGALKMDWDKDFHLLIGNEADGNRPWLGELTYVGIGRKPSPLVESASLRDSMGIVNEDKSKDIPCKGDLLIGYNMIGNNDTEILPMGSLRSDGWSIPLPPGVEGPTNVSGLVLKHSAVLKTRGSAADLSESIQLTGAFKVDVLMSPLNVMQTGPARIMTVSGGAHSRNFTLGQDGADLEFRVRNGINGTNGDKHALHVKDVLEVNYQHIVAVYDHGVSWISKNDQALGPVIDLRETPVYLFLGTGIGGRIASAILLIVGLALPAYSILSSLHPGRNWHFVVMGLTFGAGSLPYALVSLLVGGPWRSEFFFLLGLTLLVFYPIGVSYVHHSGRSLTEPRNVSA